MSEFETALREALHHRAGDPAGRWMPPGTERRVRRRQLITGGAGATVIVAAVVFATVTFTGLPQGAQPDVAGGPSSAPFDSLPRTWPTIVAGDPAEANVLPAAHVLYSGTVADADFTFAGYLVDDGATGPGPCLDFTGPAEGAERGPSVSVCASAPVGDPVPTGADLDLAGAGSSALPGIEANFGFVSMRVTTLRVELSDGSVGDVPILPTPEGWLGIRPFLFFPPAGLSGTVVALSDDGTELASAPMCVNEGVSNSCHVRVRQPVPIGLVWPEVQPDSEGRPYIDHVDGERVVGEKIPVIHGEVITPFTGGPVAYSLVVWQSAGGQFTAGEWVDLFLGYRMGDEPSALGFDAIGGGFQHRPSDLSGGAVALFAASPLEGEHGERLLVLGGRVTSDVVRLVVRAGGEVRDVALIADPLSEAHRLFVVFPPTDPAGEVTGALVALGADGSEIWSSDIERLLPPHPEAGDQGWPEPGSGSPP
jgi:hypothetical protein